MRSATKLAVLYGTLLMLLILLALNLAQASAQTVTSVEPVSEGDLQTAEANPTDRVLSQAELEQALAPIALYPDVLLSHILVASTYPLELIQAARWRQGNAQLSDEEALEATDQKDWDPSIKALVPYTELLETLSEDLDWLERVGDAFLADETSVLVAVQTLRERAREAGHLADNAYIEVVDEDDDIVIQPIEREVVYVPYYDTRVVYGDWWWADHQPIFWRRPIHYTWHAGFYWSPGIYFGHRYFFGGFHWRNRYTIVHHYNYGYRHRYRDHHRRVLNREYHRWSHNTRHRRTVRYHNVVERNRSFSNTRVRNRDVVVRNTDQRVRSNTSVVRPVHRNVSASQTQRRLTESRRENLTRRNERPENNVVTQRPRNRVVNANNNRVQNRDVRRSAQRQTSTRKDGKTDKRRYVTATDTRRTSETTNRRRQTNNDSRSYQRTQRQSSRSSLNTSRRSASPPRSSNRGHSGNRVRNNPAQRTKER